MTSSCKASGASPGSRTRSLMHTPGPSGGTEDQLVSDAGEAADGFGDVVAIGEPGPFELGGVGRGRGGGADSFDRRVEIPEALTRDGGGDLGADAEGDDGFVGDEEPAGLAHRLDDGRHVER